MDERLLKRAERRRRKLERKRERELPLFAYAGLLDQIEPLPETTEVAEQLAAWDRACAEQRERARRGVEETIAVYCAVLRRLGHEPPDLPRYAPHSPEYAADFYYRVLCGVYPRARELWMECVAAGRSVADFRALLQEVACDAV